MAVLVLVMRSGLWGGGDPLPSISRTPLSPFLSMALHATDFQTADHKIKRKETVSGWGVCSGGELRGHGAVERCGL